MGGVGVGDGEEKVGRHVWAGPRLLFVFFFVFFWLLFFFFLVLDR